MGVSIYGMVIEKTNKTIDSDNLAETFVHENFKRSLLDSEVLEYDIEDDSASIDGPSIAYSSYNYFRNELAIAALGIDFGDVLGIVKGLDDDEDYPEAIYHIINFSDCEGAIGPKAVKELSKFLTDNYTKMKEYFVKQDEEFFLSVFESLYSCINETAENDGFLIFG